jgi:hypothetical protein
MHNTTNTSCLYPQTLPISELGQAETLLLMTLRLWALPHRNPGKQYPDWRTGLLQIGAGTEACAAFDALGSLFLNYSERAMDIRCTCNTELGVDEAWFLQILAQLHEYRYWDAQEILADWLSTAVADMALMCAMHFAQCLKKAGVVIPLFARAPAEIIDFAAFRASRQVDEPAPSRSTLATLH